MAEDPSRPGPSRKGAEPSSGNPKKRIKLVANPIHDDFEFNVAENVSVCKHCGCTMKGKNPLNSAEASSEQTCCCL